MKYGKFITLEGGEGLGKTTNLVFIKTLLEEHSIHVVATREPGGTELAENLRRLLLETQTEIIAGKTELLLMFAARSQHLHNLIKPALAAGHWVLCDRFTDSTYAYQGGGRNVDMNKIAWLENFVQDELRPDLTLLFDAPVDIGMQRAQKRGAVDRFEAEKVEFFQAVREAFLQQAQQHARIKIIDAEQPLARVQSQIQILIETLLHE